MNKLTKAEVVEIIAGQMRQCEAEKMLAYLTRAERIVINCQNFIRRGKKQLPGRAVKQLAALQKQRPPRGFNKLTNRLMEEGRRPDKGIFKVLGLLQFAEHLAFQMTEAYDRAFAAEKERVTAEQQEPP